jgi:hypothetical protein
LEGDARAALAEELQISGLPIPAFFDQPTDWIDRRAKLFEAGDYPDKGVQVSDQDLADLAKQFDLPVPVWIEHAESPLELGYLTQVEAVGGELFGNIALTKEADALVERSGARALSIGLSPDLKEIREVSLVRSPRVASARLFGTSLAFAGGLCEGEDRVWREKYLALDARHRAEEARRTVDRLIKEGKMFPAEAEFASSILAASDVIDFGSDRQSVGQLLIAMIERRPPHKMFGELTPMHSNPHATMLPEEAAFYQKHFPDVSLDAIADVKGR